MKFSSSLALFFLAFSFLTAQNVYPTIDFSNTVFNQIDSTFTVKYTFSDPDNTEFDIELWMSANGGANYVLVQNGITGDVGTGLDQDGEKEVIYNHSSSNINETRLRLVIRDNETINIQDIVDQVDTDRLQSYLEGIEGIRHRTAGATKLAETQTMIKEHLTGNNMELDVTSFNFGSYTAENITGASSGTFEPADEYLVGGHYDSVDDSPGADDNGSAIAAMMEVSTILSQYNFNKSIRYVAWDLEEEGLVGSLNYVDGSIEDDQNILGYVNFEMIGYYDDEPNSQTLPAGFDLLFPDAYAEISGNEFRGDFLSSIGNTDSSQEMMEEFETIAGQYVPELNIISVAAPGTGSATPDLTRSDHAAFWSKGIPALMLTDGANFRNPYYHSPDDTSDKLDFDFMANNVKASVAYLAEKAEINHIAFQDLAIDSLISSNWDDFMNFQLKIFPNPSMDEIIVDAVDLQNNTDKIYRIYNFLGQLVTEGEHNFHYNGQLHVKFYDEPNGQYTFYIEDNQGRSSRKRFVIQN